MTALAIERTPNNRLIELVRSIDPFFAASMQDHPFESVVEPVPFWTKTQLRTVFVKTSFRTISRRYADDE